MEKLRVLIEESREIVILSSRASSNNAFVRLGLTDAVLLEAISEETPLLTDDLNLYLAALENGSERSVNFTHLRDL